MQETQVSTGVWVCFDWLKKMCLLAFVQVFQTLLLCVVKCGRRNPLASRYIILRLLRSEKQRYRLYLSQFDYLTKRDLSLTAFLMSQFFFLTLKKKLSSRLLVHSNKSLYNKEEKKNHNHSTTIEFFNCLWWQ